MKLYRIEDELKIASIYRKVFSIMNRGTRVRNATVGFHSGNVKAKVAWNDRLGFWLMWPPKSWQPRDLFIFGTQNPFEHRSRSLNITCQINVPGRRAGAILTDNKDLYLAHNGGIGGGKKGIGKTQFLAWYRARVRDTTDVLGADGLASPYIAIDKITDTTSFLRSVAKFITAVDAFKEENSKNETIDHSLNRVAKEADDEGAFQPGNITENREKVFREINLRRGQPEFRRRLIKAYGGSCAISGCDYLHALEAAHIEGYGGEITNHIQNGLLLRCDLHTLFDIGKIGIDPKTYRIVIAADLQNTVYAKFKNKKLRLPSKPAHHPNLDVLRNHIRHWKLLA